MRICALRNSNIHSITQYFPLFNSCITTFIFRVQQFLLLDKLLKKSFYMDGDLGVNI